MSLLTWRGPATLPPRAAGATSSSSGVPIEIQGLTQRMGSQIVLRDIDLDVAAGEFLTVLGASGSGKTTLLMAIAGFSLPDRGHIRIDRHEVTTVPPHRRDIGIVFQNYALFPHMSVGRNIAYPLRRRGVGRSEIERRVRQVLDLVRLSGFEDRSVASLSGGQRQRVAVARAIVFHPRVLLMDEPLSALDKPLREAMQVELRRLHSELGLTTLYVTHDQREALTLSDRIAVMKNGCVAQIGTPRDLYERPRTAFVGRFLGDSTILPVDQENGGVFLQGRPLALSTPSPGAGQFGLLLRPECLRILRKGQSSRKPGLVLSGSVTDVIYEGSGQRLQIALADGTPLAVRDGSLDGERSAMPQKGDTVEVALSIEEAVLVSMDET